jgi:hypothetical protein
MVGIEQALNAAASAVMMQMRADIVGPPVATSGLAPLKCALA